MGGRYGRRADKQRHPDLMQAYIGTFDGAESSPTNKQPATGSRIVVQEILSRPGDEKKPVTEQEFAELRIDDWTDSWKPGFAVTEWRIRWSETDQQFMWEDEQQEQWPALQTAQNRYQARLRSLKEQGFTHSDMDF
jgi:hypothetical protein